MKDLKCPFCNGDLKVTHQERYQDLVEHVSQPNAQPSMKDGYECLNESCLAFSTFNWIEDGDYYSQKPEGYDYKEWLALKKEACPSENYYAIGSWNYYYQMGKDAINAKSIKINLYFYKFFFYPCEKGWDYPEEVRHMPNIWKWKVEIWKKSSNYGYTSVIPFWRMTRFCIRQFKNAYKNWKETGNKASLQSAFCAAHSLSDFGMHPDNRFYSKLAALLIYAFQPFKVRDINNAMQNC